MSTGRRPSLLLSRQGSIPQDAPRFNTARRTPPGAPSSTSSRVRPKTRLAAPTAPHPPGQAEAAERPSKNVVKMFMELRKGSSLSLRMNAVQL